jgi:hypothetical protein
MQAPPGPKAQVQATQVQATQMRVTQVQAAQPWARAAQVAAQAQARMRTRARQSPSASHRAPAVSASPAGAMTSATAAFCDHARRALEKRFRRRLVVASNWHLGYG